MTTTPRIVTVPMSARMASTAAPSPPFLSPRPTQRPAAIAAASVTRTSSRARLRSGAGRSVRKVLARGVGGTGPSGTGSVTGPPTSAPLPVATVRRSGPRSRSGGRGPRMRGSGVLDRWCDPRGMTTSGPSGQQAPEEQPPPAPTAVERANRMSAANMIRSLLPLVVICLLAVGWVAFRQGGTDLVRPIDPSSTVQLAAARADYTVEAPSGLPDG